MMTVRRIQDKRWCGDICFVTLKYVPYYHHQEEEDDDDDLQREKENGQERKGGSLFVEVRDFWGRGGGAHQVLFGKHGFFGLID